MLTVSDLVGLGRTKLAPPCILYLLNQIAKFDWIQMKLGGGAGLLQPEQRPNQEE